MSAIPVAGFTLTPDDHESHGVRSMLLGIGGGVAIVYRGITEFARWSRTAMERMNSQDRRILELDESLKSVIREKDKEIADLKCEIEAVKKANDGVKEQNKGQEERLQRLEHQLKIAEAEKQDAVAEQLRLQIELAATKEVVFEKELKIASLEREANAKLARSDAVAALEKIEQVAQAISKTSK